MAARGVWAGWFFFLFVGFGTGLTGGLFGPGHPKGKIGFCKTFAGAAGRGARPPANSGGVGLVEGRIPGRARPFPGAARGPRGVGPGAPGFFRAQGGGRKGAGNPIPASIFHSLA